MTLNTWNTKEQSNGLSLEQLVSKLWTNPIKFYVERKKNYWYFLNDKELQTLQSECIVPFLNRVISWWIQTELKKITNKDYDISWMIEYLSNQIYTSNETPNSAPSSFLLIHQFYKELYEEKNRLPNLISNIWKKCSNLLKGLTNRP